ncbi:protein adenylyltransferase SelO [Aeromicrobium alkaliterrae]|uniref:Protein nucleotidyltransferase YdiU n=1 Tax=Aeromicrobium alkaliterrae TaxID=302168 RepID=A0ABN2JP10_9ACTN
MRHDRIFNQIRAKRSSSGGWAIRRLDDVTSTPEVLPIANRFATELPELSLPWQAEDAPDPRLLVLNEPLADELGIEPATLRGVTGARLLTGNLAPVGATPVAQAYAGHQFGGYSPRLGDGRALLVGELTDRDGNLRDLHLKGSGRTPFSRGGDGRAAVGPMLREYVISEAMHALRIPTTRSLAVVATGRAVRRETDLPGAVLARVASSHLRVGSFQYAAATGDVELVRRLADHAISRHHPGAARAENPALALLEAVATVQADLVARWMLVGFVHGVMNTDNMTISGETIDYGPCAFMEAFDPATVYSSIDTGGRYAYGNQPLVAEWNLARFAETLLPLVADDQDRAVELATKTLGTFRSRYGASYATGLLAKIGLASDPDDAVAADLGDQLLALLHANRVDWTSGFRALVDAARGDAEPLRGLVVDLPGLDTWLARWREHGPDADLMDRTNPVYVPRNHLVEEALDAATAGDLEPFHQLLDVIHHPFHERPGLERFAQPAPQDFGRYTTYCGT